MDEGSDCGNCIAKAQDVSAPRFNFLRSWIVVTISALVSQFESGSDSSSTFIADEVW
jgi:hypothetical protein